MAAGNKNWPRKPIRSFNQLRYVFSFVLLALNYSFSLSLSERLDREGIRDESQFVILEWIFIDPRLN